MNLARTRCKIDLAAGSCFVGIFLESNSLYIKTSIWKLLP